MPELQSCYFCGTVSESLRECATVPERLAPPGEEQRTVVLCTSCQEKLRRVVDPLVTRLDAAATTPDASERTRTDASERPPTDVASGGSAHQEVTFDATSDDPTASGAAGAATDPDDAAESTAEADVERDSSGTDAAGDADDGGGQGDEAFGDDAAAEAGESSAGDADGGGDTAADAGATDARETGATTDGVPDDYYKVMRLLQNREFPIDRGELTALITGAYDVSDRECETILETAKERGILAEEDGSLRLGS
ncbi:hypothetical protein [Salinirarus marinus]